jgi:hypothetical protein
MKTPLILWTILLAIVAILSPFITIWSLNTLFGLAIGYTFETWAAAGVLNTLVSGGLIQKK